MLTLYFVNSLVTSDFGEAMERLRQSRVPHIWTFEFKGAEKQANKDYRELRQLGCTEEEALSLISLQDTLAKTDALDFVL